MYINNVISYMNSWELMSSEFDNELKDIVTGLNKYTNTALKNPDRAFGSREHWQSSFESLGWQSVQSVRNNGHRVGNFQSLGVIKNGISVTNSYNPNMLGLWLFQRSAIAVRDKLVRIPILLLPKSEYARRLSGERHFYFNGTFENIKNQLEQLVPLSHLYPFLIFGYSDVNSLFDIEVTELTSSSNGKSELFERTINFPPEYHQAGIGILSFFGTYLNEKYPNSDAIVRIEQHGLTVKLIIEGSDGFTEVLEKALSEYELIVSNQVPPEKFTDNVKLILELKQEIRIAQVRIDSQNDIISIQNTRIDKLMDIIGMGLSKQIPISIDFKPTISISNVQQGNQVVSNALNTIEELKDYLPQLSEAYQEVENIELSLQEIEFELDPKTVKQSSALNQLKAYIESASEAGSAINKGLNATEKGWEIFQSLATKYNKIAEWCGLPQVPSVFTK